MARFHEVNALERAVSTPRRTAYGIVDRNLLSLNVVTNESSN